MNPALLSLMVTTMKLTDHYNALYFEYSDNVLVSFEVDCDRLQVELADGYQPAPIRITEDQRDSKCIVQWYTFTQNVYKQDTPHLVPRLELFTYVYDIRRSGTRTIQSTSNPIMYYIGGYVEEDTLMQRFTARLQHAMFPCGNMGKVSVVKEEKSITIMLKYSNQDQDQDQDQDQKVVIDLPTECQDNCTTFTKEWVESNGYTGGECGYEGKTFYNHVLGNSKLTEMDISSLHSVEWSKFHPILGTPSAAFYYPDPIPFWIQVD